MNIVVYCGASSGNSELYQKTACLLGKWIGENNHQLVYGGGNVGLMGEVADSTLNYQGKVIGIIPEFLKKREIAHKKITSLIIVQSMSDRKNKMLELGDVFIALPGGPGTLEEIVEAISLARLGKNNKPCIFFNVNNYYQHLQMFFDHMVHQGFLTKNEQEKILFATSIDEINNFIDLYEPPKIREYKETGAGKKS